jgi:hypothetical protein
MRRISGALRTAAITGFGFAPFRCRISEARSSEGTISIDTEDPKRAEPLQANPGHVSQVSTLGELAAAISHELK